MHRRCSPLPAVVLVLLLRLVAAHDATGSIYFVDLDHEPRIYVAAPSGVVVTTITAIRQDFSDLQPRYMLHGNSTDINYFQIHPETGNITTRRYIDRSVGSKYLVVVAAYSNDEVAYINLSIRVVEYNRYPPVFNSSNYKVWVDVRTPIGTIILQVYALDKDTKPYNSEIQYSIEKQSVVSINRYTGQLILREKLLPDKRNLTFTIAAEDGGSPRRLSKAQVTLVLKTTAESCQANNTTDYLCYCSNYMNGSICFMNKSCGNIEHTCFTGGNCSWSTNFTFSCKCPAGYYGPNCNDFDPCLYSPCLHKAMCVGKLNFKYMCRCEAGHTGVYCERKTDDCSSQPCFNSGTCIDASNSYVCNCAEGYSGKRCEEFVAQCPDETLVTDKGIFKWPSVQSGKKAFILCPYNAYQNLSALHWNEDTIYLDNNENNFNGEENLLGFHQIPHIFLKGNYDEFSSKKDFQLEPLNPYIHNSTNISYKDRFMNYRPNFALRACSRMENGTIVWEKMDDSACKNKVNLHVVKSYVQFEEMTRDPLRINTTLFLLATKHFEHTLKYVMANIEIAQSMINIMSNLMAANYTVLDDCDTDGSLSQQIVDMLYEYCSYAKLPNAEETIVSENIILKTSDFVIEEDTINEDISFSPVHEQYSLQKALGDDVGNKNVSLSIPADALLGLKNLSTFRVFFVSFTNSKFFRSAANKDKNYFKNQDQRVITACVLNVSMANLTESVTYTLPNIYGNAKQTCVYWDTESKEWRRDGLDTNQSELLVECFSTHMTAFSVRLDPGNDQPSGEDYAGGLSYLAYLGSVCGILSLAAAAAAALTSTRDMTHTGRIFVNLCISLILTNLSFLALAFKDYVTLVDVCTGATLLNHYLVPVCLIWMVFVAFDMHDATTNATDNYGPSYILRKIIFAWILPFVVVAFCAAYDLQLYESRDTRYCFFVPRNVYVYCTSYLAPCCAIMVVDLVVLGVVSNNLSQNKGLGKVRPSGQAAVTNKRVLCAMLSMALFGIAWVFGALALSELKHAFQYVFSGINLLQGLTVLWLCCGQRWARVTTVTLSRLACAGKAAAAAEQPARRHALRDYALDLAPPDDDVVVLTAGLPVLQPPAGGESKPRGCVSIADRYFSRKEGIYSSWQYLKMPLKGIMKGDKLKQESAEISVVGRGNKQMSQSFIAQESGKEFTYINTKTVIISDQSYIAGSSAAKQSLGDVQLEKGYGPYAGLTNPTTSNFYELKEKLDQNLSFRDFNDESYGLSESDKELGQLSHIYCLLPQITECAADTFVVVNGQTVYTNNPSVRLNLGEKNLLLPYGDASIRQSTCKSNSRISIIRFDEKKETRKNSRYKSFLHNLSDSLNLGSDKDSCTSDSCDSTCNTNVRACVRNSELKKFIKY